MTWTCGASPAARKSPAICDLLRALLPSRLRFRRTDVRRRRRRRRRRSLLALARRPHRLVSPRALQPAAAAAPLLPCSRRRVNSKLERPPRGNGRPRRNATQQVGCQVVLRLQRLTIPFQRGREIERERRKGRFGRCSRIHVDKRVTYIPPLFPPLT